MSALSEASQAHWSEAKRRGMEDFYALATADYRHLAEAIDWRAWLEARQRAVGERPMRLLDVACGSGKFPAALIRHAGVAEAAIRPVDCALLDPSEFSLSEARAGLRLPFVAGQAYQCPLEALETPSGAFDILWATHALYALPEAALEDGLERFLTAMRGGTGVIAHAAADSHYLRWQALFLEAFRGGAGTMFTSAESIVAALERLGAGIEVCEITYETAAPCTDGAQVEGFLQRCVFDDTVSLAEMQNRAPTAAYLAACRDDTAWRFPQTVKLIFIRA